MRAYSIVAILLVAIFGSIALVLWGKSMQRANQDFQTPPLVVESTTARRESRAQYLQAVGTLRARRGIDVTSKSSGEVIEINFESGDSIEKAQLLVILNNEVEQASKLSQLAAVKLAKLQYDRDVKLQRKKSISQTQLDQSRSELDQARAQLAETEARLSDKQIRAAFSGSVGIREVDLGDYISPGTLITTLQDLTELELDFTIPAQAVAQIKVGLPIQFRVSAFPGKVFHGEVLALNTKVDASTRNLKVRAKVTAEKGLLPGMFTEVQVTVGEPQSLVTIPETAVSYSLHGNSVYVVEKSDKGLAAKSQIITTGEARNGWVSVFTGLEEGMVIVSAGQNKLYPGAAIVLSEENRAGVGQPEGSAEKVAP
jgi:membrane fusion protein, multidrug efflux system